MRASLGLSITALALTFGACSSDSSSSVTDDTSDAGSTTDGDAGSSDGSKATVTNEAIEVAGTTREYVLAVPMTLADGRAYPLVLVFHGDGGTGATMRAYHTFDAVSGDEAIVAYPSGIDAGWDLQSPSATNPDIAFVETLVAALAGKYKIDLSRVFGSGYSSGAFLVNKIACRKTGFFRAIVSNSGGAPDEEQDPAASTWPATGYTKCAGQTGGVAAMIVHGDKDTTVTPDSGDFDATYWASLNGCKDTRSETTPPPCKKHDDCPTGQPVLWCLIPGLDHTIWENGAKEAWAFMKSL